MLFLGLQSASGATMVVCTLDALLGSVKWRRFVPRDAALDRVEVAGVSSVDQRITALISYRLVS
jgi:hypothetical protein